MKPDWHKALFVVSMDKLDSLTELRNEQGYFEEGVVLRTATLGELMDEYPGINLLSDYRMRITADGFQDGGAFVLVDSERNVNKFTMKDEE